MGLEISLTDLHSTLANLSESQRAAIVGYSSSDSFRLCLALDEYPKDCEEWEDPSPMPIIGLGGDQCHAATADRALSFARLFGIGRVRFYFNQDKSDGVDDER